MGILVFKVHFVNPLVVWRGECYSTKLFMEGFFDVFSLVILEKPFGVYRF